MTLHFRGWTSFGYVKWRDTWVRVYRYKNCPNVYVFVDQKDYTTKSHDTYELAEFMRALENNMRTEGKW